MMYYGYNYGGMNLIWWFIWMGLLFWMFATPYTVPGQRKRPDSPLAILQNRFALGQISKEQYQESKAILEEDLIKS